eukprot:3293581-Prymnesium_polylepis.1
MRSHTQSASEHASATSSRTESAAIPGPTRGCGVRHASHARASSASTRAPACSSWTRTVRSVASSAATASRKGDDARVRASSRIARTA